MCKFVHVKKFKIASLYGTSMDTRAKHRLKCRRTYNIKLRCDIIFNYMVVLCPMSRSTPVLAPS